MGPGTQVFKGGSSAATTEVVNSKTLVANNTTAAVPVFGITGAVEIVRLWAAITTVFGSNHTAAFFRLNDQTAQVAITLATGVTLSSKTAGSVLVKKGLAASALVLVDNAVGAISEPTTAETIFHSPFVAAQKSGATTNIEYVYTTTNTPTTGALEFHCEYRPLTPGAGVTAL